LADQELVCKEVRFGRRGREELIHYVNIQRGRMDMPPSRGFKRLFLGAGPFLGT
jgi:hypothetical protein